jgi:hypothetical protein
MKHTNFGNPKYDVQQHFGKGIAPFTTKFDNGKKAM